MHITSIDPPSAFAPSGGYREIARFDLQLTPQLRLYGLRLLEAPDGRRLTYAPSSGGRRFATFDPALIAEITNAANAAFNKGRVTANGNA